MGQVAGGILKGVGSIGKTVSGLVGAHYAGKAANAQQQAAIQQREDVLNAVAPSPQEMQAMESSIRLTEAGISRQQKILDSVDPALIEAGHQALSLLQGHESQFIQPLREERDRQRNQMRQNLASQLGPGFETSSAGIKAMNEFDNQTAQMVNSTQMQMLGGLLNLSASVRPDPYQGVAAQQSIAGMFAQQGTRKAQGILSTPLQPYAGAPWVGRSQTAGVFGDFFGDMAATGQQMMTMGMGGGGGGQTSSGSFGSMTRMPTSSWGGSSGYGAGGAALGQYTGH